MIFIQLDIEITYSKFALAIRSYSRFGNKPLHPILAYDEVGAVAPRWYPNSSEPDVAGGKTPDVLPNGSDREGGDEQASHSLL